MSDIEWGPEIAVDGERPEWLGEDDNETPLWWTDRPGINEAFTKVGKVIWKQNHHPMSAIRLPANHPHYQQQAWTPDERTLQTVIMGVQNLGRYGSQEYRDGFDAAVAKTKMVIGDLMPKPDPDVEVVRKVLEAWYDGGWKYAEDQPSKRHFDRAVSVYKANKS